VQARAQREKALSQKAMRIVAQVALAALQRAKQALVAAPRGQMARALPAAAMEWAKAPDAEATESGKAA